MFDRVILHCDLNNFYASVEAILNPEYKDKPLAVCGDPKKRHGIVLAKSNIAKAAGVKTGEAVWEAKQKCPDLIVVAPTFGKYTEYSRKVYDIYTHFTSEVESFGLDECWLDVTGSQKLFGSGEEIAYKIKETVKAETGLTISVGVSFSKVFAKLGSDMKKPDAVTVLSPDNFRSVAWRLPASEMIYVGHSTERKLAAVGIHTIGDIAMADVKFLVRNFGKMGEKLWQWANGTDGERVKCYTERHIPRSIGNGTTTPEDITNVVDAESVIYALSEMIAFRLRQHNMVASGVSVNMRNTLLESVSRQGKLSPQTASAYEIGKRASEILALSYDFNSSPPLRTITVGTFGLSRSDQVQQSSFFSEMSDKTTEIEERVDKLRKKYGYGVVRRGVTVGTIFCCDSREADDDFLPFDKNNKNLYED